jgi:hypothetical protein
MAEMARLSIRMLEDIAETEQNGFPSRERMRPVPAPLRTPRG